MSWKKATPGEGKEAAAEHFSYVSPPAGLKTFTAWCAGEAYWCKAHEHTDRQPGTKVCVAWFTDGALICPRCRPKVLPTTIAYVPLYREIDHKPVFVIVHESAADLLAELHYGVFCLVGRVEKGSSVFVRKSAIQETFKTENPLRKSACDLSLTLTTLWGYGAVNQWILEQENRARREGNRDVPAVRNRLSVPPPTTRVEALAIDAERRAGGDGAAVPIDATLDELAKKFKVKTNGTHPPNE